MNDSKLFKRFHTNLKAKTKQPKPKIKRYPKGVEEFITELPYWHMASNIVVAKNGVMEAGIEIDMPNTTLADRDDLIYLHQSICNALHSGVIEKERLRLIIEINSMRPTLLNKFKEDITSRNPIAKEMANERFAMLEKKRRASQIVEYRVFLTCSYSAKKRKPNTAFLPEEFAEAKEAIEDMLYKIMASLDKGNLNPRRMTHQEMFELMWRFLNPDRQLSNAPLWQPQETYLPKEFLERHRAAAPLTLRAQVVETSLRRRSNSLVLGDSKLGVVSLRSLPINFTYIGMLKHLLQLPHNFWIVSDFVHLPYAKELRQIRTRLRRLESAIGDGSAGVISDSVDPDLAEGKEQLEAAFSHTVRTGEKIYNIGSSVIVIEKDDKKLSESLRDVQDAFDYWQGTKSLREVWGLKEQFFKLLPFSGEVNERLTEGTEANAADMFPFEGPWLGKHPSLIFGNRWDSLTAIDPFDKDQDNYNGIIIGGSGTGKTFLAQIIISQLLKEDAEVMIVDRGYGYAPLVELFGGTIIPIEPKSGISINPFDLPEGCSEPNDEKKAFIMAVLKAMLSRANDGSLEATKDAIITAAIEQTYQRATTEERSETGTEKIYQGARLSDLVTTLTTLEQIGERAITNNQKAIAEDIALQLQRWTGDSPFGQFIDRETTVNPNASIVYYETTGLDKYSDLIGPAMLLMTEQIWKKVQANPTRRKIVVFDEAWSILKIPEAAHFMVELYRRFRRYHAAVYSVTQSLADFMTEQARGILQNTTTHYLLRLPGEDKLIQELFHLTDSAMNKYRKLSSRKGQYSEMLTWIREQQGPKGDIVIVQPTPLEYWAFTTQAKEMALRKETAAEKGLLEAIKELARLYPKGLR